jgi:prepilin-type N-terminal cleavage/methylation domain-containing protein
MQKGFSLVELSIVLVILGLLTGGILSGQSLIRAAELRSVVTEYQRYVTAVQSFRNQYMALPGDMKNASAFWGRNNAACPTHGGASTPNGTCNGNGDNIVTYDVTTANATNENFQFWHQLSLSGLISGNFTGVNHSTTNEAASRRNGYLGVNVPAGRIGTSRWNILHIDSSEVIVASHFRILGSRFEIFEGVVLGNVHLLTSEEMYSLDSKIDDTKPFSGEFGSVRIPCSTAPNNNPSNVNADYNLSDKSKICRPAFYNVF